MALKKVTERKRIGVKVLATGETNTGKSYFGLTFPDVGAVDSETGLAFYIGRDIEIGGKKYNNVQFVDETCSLDDMEENLDAIIEGEIDGLGTFVVDSETKIYNTMVEASTEVEERKAKLAGNNYDQRKMWATVKRINGKLQQAKITASAKGINVVSVAQGKFVKDEDTKTTSWKIEAHNSLAFDYDIILRFFTEVDKKTKEIRYFAEVIKDRTQITQTGDIIENCTYDIWQPAVEGMAGLNISEANFVKDTKDSKKSVLADAEKAEKVAKAITAILKSLEPEQQRKAKEKIDKLELNIRQLAYENLDALTELLEFIKGL